MKRLNPKTNLPFKRGDLREDGLVFRAYRTGRVKKNGEFAEEWLTPAAFKKEKESRNRWDAINAERRKENRKRRYKVNSEQEKENNRRWRQANPEKLKKIFKLWRQNNPNKINSFSAKRRAAKLQRTPLWLTKKQLLEIQSFYTKAKEMESLTGVKHHVDHIVPLQGDNVSGLHVPWNLQVISATENINKGNKWHVD